MCLIKRSFLRYSKAKIAEKDIVVYKYTSNILDNSIFTSDIISFLYNKDEINIDIDLFSFNVVKCLFLKIIIITEGYHSFKNIKLLKKSYLYDSESCKIAKFIIPKGSSYYKNNDGEIVSSNIIYTGELIEN